MNVYVYVIALVIQQENRIFPAPYYIVILSRPCFSTLSHKRHDFREKKKKKKLLNIKCVFWFSLRRLIW